MPCRVSLSKFWWVALSENAYTLYTCAIVAFSLLLARQAWYLREILRLRNRKKRLTASASRAAVIFYFAPPGHVCLLYPRHGRPVVNIDIIACRVVKFYIWAGVETCARFELYQVFWIMQLRKMDARN